MGIAGKVLTRPPDAGVLTMKRNLSLFAANTGALMLGASIAAGLNYRPGIAAWLLLVGIAVCALSMFLDDSILGDA